MKPILSLATHLFVPVFMLDVCLAAFPILFSENFDIDSTANWNDNAGVGFDINDPNFPPAPMDSEANFFFDYSSVGIPSAPNSTGGSTLGMKLQANLTSNSFGGFSVSPTGQSFSSDYSITFDAWSSSIGPFPFGASGSTNSSTFGLLTSGTVSNVPLNTDGVWFSYTGDGGTTADYRVYSSERDFSYQLPIVDLVDMHATHHAGTRDGTGQLYLDAIGDPNNNLLTVPQSVIDANPLADLSGQLFSGAAGFQWHQHEIRKVGNTVEWFLNGFLLITLDTGDFAVPTGGNNILFGHFDNNFLSSTDANKEELLFSLVDNVVVTSLIPEPASALLVGLGIMAAAAVRPSRLALAKN